MTDHIIPFQTDGLGRMSPLPGEPIAVLPGDTISVVASFPEIGDRITMLVTEYPPWWAFWRKPRKVTKPFVVTLTASASSLADDFDPAPGVAACRPLGD